jgi:hypothetical protein
VAMSGFAVSVPAPALWAGRCERGIGKALQEQLRRARALRPARKAMRR